MTGIFTHSFGTLSSAPDNTTINKIYEFLSQVLFNFKGKSDENEDALTNRLCKTLNAKKPTEYPFFFHHQNLENDRENTSTDFAVFGTFSYAQENNIDNNDSPSLIKFEAKRLNSKLPKRREKEYVCGEYFNGICVKNSGGIERFKNGRHGKDVIHAGIIGYIQTDTFQCWFQKVNEWIQEQILIPNDRELIWKQNDLLIFEGQNGNLSNFISSSQRISGDIINFRHFWIEISG